jgi:hypothetical protein
VDFDMQGGLYESIDLVVGNQKHTQSIDYVNMPFWCACCHMIGHLMVDCGVPIMKKKCGSKNFKVLTFETKETVEVPSVASYVVVLGSGEEKLPSYEQLGDG